MSDPKNAGEQLEDVVENIISDASPLEDEKTDGGTDEAGRSGADAVDDDSSFTA